MLRFNPKQEINVTENLQLKNTYALLKEVYGPLENLSQIQWSQIEWGVKVLMKEHGPEIPIGSLKAMKYTYDNFHTEQEVSLDFIGNHQ